MCLCAPESNPTKNTCADTIKTVQSRVQLLFQILSEGGVYVDPDGTHGTMTQLENGDFVASTCFTTTDSDGYKINACKFISLFGGVELTENLAYRVADNSLALQSDELQISYILRPTLSGCDVESDSGVVSCLESFENSCVGFNVVYGNLMGEIGLALGNIGSGK